MSLIICQGPSKGDAKKFRCGCCGVESDNIEAFAPGGMCWMCGFGSNLDCERCIEYGVPVDRFSDKRGKLHRARHQDEGSVVTACGFRIERDDVGQATAVRTDCRRCWPEDDA